MKALLLPVFCCFLLLPNPANGQNVPRDSVEVYRVNPWLSLGITGASIAVIQPGRKRNHRKPQLTEDEVMALSTDRISAFDRVALRQDHTRRLDYEAASNTFLFALGISPALLFLDRDIRRDWLDVTLLYLETQTLSNAVHTWVPFGPAFVDRLRPRSYYQELPFPDRSSGNARNSFYGGHVAAASCASFFIAKVLDDYHPDWGAKKWIAYGLAAVPPIIMSVQRVRALQHFPSDNLVGILVGGATGILIPELHRVKDGNLKMSLLYQQQFRGLALDLTF
jgi:membrane-associated phospholipid phosphatase